MTNQVLNRKGASGFDRLERSEWVAVAIIVLMIVASAVFSLNRPAPMNEVERTTEVRRNLSALPQDGRAYFTEPYWQMGAGDANGTTAAEPEYSYYTERYWLMGQ